MTGFVVDASVAIKWVISEPGTDQAVSLLAAGSLAAPDLLIAECANILWKKVRRSELTEQEAVLTSRILQQADLELFPMRALLESATQLAIELDHPAYDCVYLALALQRGTRFVTADKGFVAKATRSGGAIKSAVLSLRDVVGGVER